ncbi:MAG: hypothetical protein KGD61_05610 [Candidatus Lokiarchaeota archaeon]|nr:hypothetical protein [Candidatus Lokiarchaeota archaeon]
MIPFHCARPRGACKKCTKLAEEGEKYCLVSFQFSSEEMARPMMTLEINVEDTLCEVNLIKIFNDESEARKYAIENGVDMLES